MHAAMHDDSAGRYPLSYPQHGVKHGEGEHGAAAAARNSAVPAQAAAAGGGGPRWHQLGPTPRYRRSCERRCLWGWSRSCRYRGPDGHGLWPTLPCTHLMREAISSTQTQSDSHHTSSEADSSMYSPDEGGNQQHSDTIRQPPHVLSGRLFHVLT